VNSTMSTLSTPRSVIETEESQSGSPGSTIRMITTETKSSKLPDYLSQTQIDNVFRESYITSEYCLVTNVEKLGGVYVIPSQQSCNMWFGVMFIHQGPFMGGVFRFVIQFPEGFPTNNIVPTISFQPPVFHPCVHPLRGVFDLRRHFKYWSKAQNHVWQLLRAVKAAFHKVEMSTFNKSAHDMFLNDPNSFMIRAQHEAELSISRVYDNPNSEYEKDTHWIKFSTYDPKIHDQIRAKALKPMDRLQGNPRLLSPYNNSSTLTVSTMSYGTSFL